MSRAIEYAPWFDTDLHFRTAWYAEKAGVDVAESFVTAVEATVRELAETPSLGRRPYPNDPDLAQVYSSLVKRPFHKHIIFYRFSSQVLTLERLIHGARDLPRRIGESPFESD